MSFSLYKIQNDCDHIKKYEKEDLILFFHDNSYVGQRQKTKKFQLDSK
jgi:hypothetical protein